MSVIFYAAVPLRVFRKIMKLNIIVYEKRLRYWVLLSGRVKKG
jgi:hypothetical protein